MQSSWFGCAPQGQPSLCAIRSGTFPPVRVPPEHDYKAVCARIKRNKLDPQKRTICERPHFAQPMGDSSVVDEAAVVYGYGYMLPGVFSVKIVAPTTYTHARARIFCSVFKLFGEHQKTPESTNSTNCTREHQQHDECFPNSRMRCTGFL